MGEALIAAAQAAGIRITLIDACYLWAGLGEKPLEGVQQRFGDGDVESWAARVERLRPPPHARVAAAAHSVRAVDRESIRAVAAWAKQHDAPFHVHVSEQPAENADCRAATGLTPTALLAEAGALTGATTAVHATHVDAADVALLGGAAARICLCPTTERDLADGVGPAAELAAAGARLCVGTDSHAVIDVFEEARAIELDERLVSGRRGIHPAERLLEAATAGGYRSLGWPGGRLEAGCPADFVTLDLESPRLRGIPPDDLAAGTVFAATAADVTRVVVGGRTIVGG
jgi:formiminoglutamate deiminase